MSSVMTSRQPPSFPSFHRQSCRIRFVAASCGSHPPGGVDFDAVEVADSAVVALEDVVVAVAVEAVVECGEGVGGEVAAVPLAADDCSLF